MRHLTASQRIAHLEQRIARLEKQASGYKTARTSNFFKKYIHAKDPTVVKIEVMDEGVSVSGSGFVYLIRAKTIMGKTQFYIYHSYGRGGKPDLLLQTRDFQEAMLTYADVAIAEDIH